MRRDGTENDAERWRGETARRDDAERRESDSRTTQGACLAAAARTTRPLDPHALAPALHKRRPSRCALDKGSLRTQQRAKR